MKAGAVFFPGPPAQSKMRCVQGFVLSLAVVLTPGSVPFRTTRNSGKVQRAKLQRLQRTSSADRGMSDIDETERGTTTVTDAAKVHDLR